MEVPVSKRARHLILTVHGIRTFGHWQERLEALIGERDPEVRVWHYKYGYFSCVAFLVPLLRWWLTRRFRRSLLAACGAQATDRIDIVAHSFGTHLVAWGLHGTPRAQRPKIHTLIFAGSVLKPSFPWQELTGSSVGRVLNDCGTRDSVLVLNQVLVLFTGMAGRVGFAGMSHERFRNRFFEHGHSGYFLRAGRSDDEFMRTWWLPALLGDEPLTAPEDPRDTSPIRGLWAFLLNNAEPVKVAVVVAPLVLLTVLFFGLYRQAGTEQANAQRRLVALQVSHGERCSHDGDLASALVWYAEALRSDSGLGAREHRVRIASALRQHPDLLQVLFLEKWGPKDAVFSPDGTRLVISYGYGEAGARVFDVASGEATTPLLAHGNAVNAVAFSPDGNRVATASSDYTARIWNASTGTPITAPLRHDEGVVRVSFSPAGEHILTVARPIDRVCQARLWDATSGAAVGVPMVHEGLIGCAAFSPDGKLVATISDDGTTGIWDARTGERTGAVIESGDGSSRFVVAFSPQGRRLVTSNGEQVQVWDAATGDAVADPWPMDCALVEFLDERIVLGVDSDGATRRYWVESREQDDGPHRHGNQHDASGSVSNTPARGVRIALATSDGARLWDAASEEPLTPVLRHTGAVERIRFSHDGRRVVTIDASGIVRVWDVGSSPAIILDHDTLFHAPSISSASFSPDGRFVLSVAFDGNAAHLWDATSGAHQLELQHGHLVRCACFSPDGDRVVTTSKDGTARLWNVRTGEAVGDLAQHKAAVATVGFSPDGRSLITGCEDGTAHVWSTGDGSEPRLTIAHGPPIVATLFSPDGRAVFVAGGVSALLYDAETGKRMTDGPRQNESGLLAASLSRDGTRIATAGPDGVARVWDAQSGEPITPPLVHSGGTRNANFPQRVNHCVFSPDGNLLATASADGTTRTWNAATGAPAAPPLVGQAEHVAFSPDGRWLATAGTDGTARVWEVHTGAALTPRLAHDIVVSHVAFDAHGQRLLSASWDGTVRIWSLAADSRSPDALRCLAEILACRRVDESGGLVDLSAEELRDRWSSSRPVSRR